MITPVKTYLVTCDCCGKEELLHSMIGTALPKGWKCIHKEDENVYVDCCSSCLLKRDKKMNGHKKELPPLQEDGDEARMWVGIREVSEAF